MALAQTGARPSWLNPGMKTEGPAATAWAGALRAWRIPDEILAAAPESPWQFPTALFDYDSSEEPTPTHTRVDEGLPAGGTLLDVGAGGGAASLPMAHRALRIVAVDESEVMLERFASAAARARVGHSEVVGRWPEASSAVDRADVVVCANVVYNVAEIAGFVTALTEHARLRVVLEASVRHPLTATASLWNRFHPAAPRPEGPDLEDIVAVLTEIAIAPHMEFFERRRVRHLPRDEVVAFVRRRLCVTPDRDAEIDAWLGDPPALGLDSMATLWWDGSGP